MRKKVSIFGAGNVGASLAQLVVSSGMADAALVDVAPGLAQGKALDLSHARPLYPADVKVEGSTDASIIKGSDLVVITAGITRKPGMSRDQLLETNARIVAECASATKKHAPKAFIIVVSNPLDAMTWLAQIKSGFDPHRVMGMAGVLDSARFISFLADALDASVKDIQAMVLGGHGDQMVPLLSSATWQGRPVEELIPKDQLEKIVDRTRNAGAEIVSLMNTSAFYSPATAAFTMIQAIFSDAKRLMPCSAALSGQYGVKDLYLGVPVILGKKGVEQVVMLKLSKTEKEQFARSADAVSNLVAQLRKLKV